MVPAQNVLGRTQITGGLLFPGSQDLKYLEDHYSQVHQKSEFKDFQYFQVSRNPNIWRTTISRSTRSQNWRISNLSRVPRSQNWQISNIWNILRIPNWQISNIGNIPSNQHWQISNFGAFQMYFYWISNKNNKCLIEIPHFYPQMGGLW